MPIKAIESGVFDAGSMMGEGWKLEGVKFALSELSQKKPKLKFSANKLTLPKPFHDLAVADIQCHDFKWGQDELHCNQGRASVSSRYWQSPTTQFSFHLKPQKSTISFDDVRLLGSRLSLNFVLNDGHWQCNLDAKHIGNHFIDKLFQAKSPKSEEAQKKQGNLDLNGNISGYQDKVQGFNFNIEVGQLTDQTEDGKIAAEKLDLLTHWEGKLAKNNLWYWQSESKMLSGALYVDPVYLEIGLQPIVLNAQGAWNTKTKQADIRSFTYRHPDAVVLNGSATGYYNDGIKVDKADVVLQSETLQGLLTTYLNPFFTESPLIGVAAAGDLQAKFTFVKQALKESSIHFSHLNIKDEAGRLAIKEGFGSINWSNDPLQTKHSELAWQQLAIKGLPLDASRLKFTGQANYFELAEKIKLPFLNGSVAVDRFSWQGNKQDEPDVSFAGSLDNISLEALSKSLGWVSLSGKLSGQIPRIDYHNKTLNLGGELLIKVFDGTVRVNNLGSSGLFSNSPKVTGDITVENLDLDQITQKFEFGNITGRLSGYINKLVLENWHPVTFFAWFGTPDDDDSSHRISQKAVKNIASIGGGAATDLLSRSFLGFFETFGYDKIGVGCYLHNGVCQMMGLEAEGQGYYLIKGGGLPRIDVLGYNPQVNWDVLVERLARVASPEKVIVK
jgi:hypothetical protein